MYCHFFLICFKLEEIHILVAPLFEVRNGMSQDKSSILQVVVPNRRDIVSVIVHHDDDDDDRDRERRAAAYPSTDTIPGMRRARSRRKPRAATSAD